MKQLVISDDEMEFEENYPNSDEEKKKLVGKKRNHRVKARL